MVPWLKGFIEFVPGYLEMVPTGTPQLSRRGLWLPRWPPLVPSIGPWGPGTYVLLIPWYLGSVSGYLGSVRGYLGLSLVT